VLPVTTCSISGVAAGTYFIDVIATNAAGYTSAASAPRVRFRV
jgi:hypothetical protein